MIDLVDFEQEGLDDVMPDELEARVAEVVRDVLAPAREEVVDHDHRVPALHQPAGRKVVVKAQFQSSRSVVAQGGVLKQEKLIPAYGGTTGYS